VTELIDFGSRLSAPRVHKSHRRLLGALLAASLVVAGYAAFLSVRDEPVPTVARPALAPVEDTRPPLPPLPPAPTVRRAADASVAGQARPVGEVRVKLTGDAPDGVGVALVAEDSRAVVGFELAAAAQDGSLTFAGVPAGDYWVALTAAAADASHRYLTRTRVGVVQTTAGVGGEATLDLTLVALEVSLLSADGMHPLPHVPVELERAGEPAWCMRRPERPPPQPGLDLTDREGNVTLGPIGMGRYRLRIAGYEPVPADAAKLDVDVPGPAEITLRLARRR
jgi:hypothetical protein